MVNYVEDFPSCLISGSEQLKFYRLFPNGWFYVNTTVKFCDDLCRNKSALYAGQSWLQVNSHSKLSESVNLKELKLEIGVGVQTNSLETQ